MSAWRLKATVGVRQECAGVGFGENEDVCACVCVLTE